MTDRPLTEKKESEPKPGEVWRRARFYQMSVGHPQETRHVIDRTLGGGVVYVSGRFTRRSWHHVTCTLAEWREWVAGGFRAKRVPQ